MPKLSVIVPVYNVAAYLPACIDSILSQTLRDLELILIDDGSPDNCGAICDAYAAQDSRVRVLHQTNSGVSSARNAGLRITTGSFIGFVDPDDWISPEMFEKLCCAQEEADAEIAICGFVFCGEDGQTIKKQPVPAGVVPRENLLLSIYGMPNRFHGSMCNKIFSKRLFETSQFDESVAVGEDWLLLYDCYCRCTRAAAIPECCYYVRRREGSATRKLSAELYVQKLNAYYRLYQHSRSHSRKIQRQAAAKILDTCLVNKREISAQKENQHALRYVNRLLRRTSLQAFFRHNLSGKKFLFYFMKGFH